MLPSAGQICVACVPLECRTDWDALAAQQDLAAQPGRVLRGDGGLVPDAVHELRLQGCSPKLRQQVGHASGAKEVCLATHYG